MTRLGEAHGVRTAAMITALDTPLGRAVGNAVEVRQALDELGDAALATCGIWQSPSARLCCGSPDQRRPRQSPSRRPCPGQVPRHYPGPGRHFSPLLAQGRALGTVTAWRDGLVRLDA